MSLTFEKVAPALQRLRMLRRKFSKSETGSIAVLFGIAAPVVIGMAGLSIDYNMWKKQKIALDRNAESAAYSAALAKTRGAEDLVPYALANAELNGFDTSRGTLDLTTSGDAIIVTVTRNSDRYLSSIITSGDVLIDAAATVDVAPSEAPPSATGATTSSDGYPCIVTYESNPTTNRGLYMHDNAFIDASGCGVHSNATSVGRQYREEGSIYLRNGDITADTIRGVGEVIINSSNGRSTTSVEPESNAAVFPDPFVSMVEPSFNGCDNNGQTVNFVRKPVKLEPGTYCGDIIIQNGGSARFEPGLYHIVDGNFFVRGGGTVRPSKDVTFFFGGDNPGKWVIDNGAKLKLEAPDNGATAGMLFWQTAKASCGTSYNQQNRFAGGADFELSGVIYGPNCGLIVDNNSELKPANRNAHISIHAAWIEMAGGTNITVYGTDADQNVIDQTGYTAESPQPSSDDMAGARSAPRLRY